METREELSDTSELASKLGRRDFSVVASEAGPVASVDCSVLCFVNRMAGSVDWSYVSRLTSAETPATTLVASVEESTTTRVLLLYVVPTESMVV